MTRNVAVKFWRKHLKIVTCGAGDGILLNPALDFTSQAKCGEFDSIPDDEYKKMLDDCEDVASFWQNQPTASATMVLINALSKTPLPEKSLQKIADTLAACSEDCCYALRTQDDDVSYDDDEWYEQIDGDLDNKKPLSSWTPKEIYDALCQQVHGQDDAKRAAAMVMHGNLHGRRSNAVFCGPSGCGKSEIWRVLSHKFPGRIRMIDASRLSADGWTGSVHLRDIFTGISPLTIKRRGLIVVLDEADKVCCEKIGRAHV